MGEETHDQVQLSDLQGQLPQDQYLKLSALFARLDKGGNIGPLKEALSGVLQQSPSQALAGKTLTDGRIGVKVGKNARVETLTVHGNIVAGDYYARAEGDLIVNNYYSDLASSGVPRRWRIYISHYAKQGLEHKVLVELMTRLNDAEVEILPDGERLEHESPPWKPELYTWMGLAHHAVVLISKSALEFPWFVSEMRILSARYYLREFRDSSFEIIPVLLDDTTPADLQQHGLSLEGLEPPITGRTSEQVVDGIMDQLSKTIGDEPGASALEVFQRQIVDIIKDADRGVLIDAARSLGKTFPRNPDYRQVHDWIAVALWHASPQAWKAALETLYNDRSVQAKFEELVGEGIASWVPICSSCYLIDAARHGAHKRAVLLQRQGAAPRFTGFSFIRRAFYLPARHDWPTVEINQLNDPSRDPLEVIDQELKKQILREWYDSENQEQNDQYLQLSLSEDKRPVIILIDDPPGPKVLEKIFNIYKDKNYIFLLVTSDIVSFANIPGALLPDPPLKNEGFTALMLLRQKRIDLKRLNL